MDRTTHAIVYYPDVLFAYDNLSIEAFPFDPSWELLNLSDAITCHKEHAEVIAVFNRALKEMRDNGVLRIMLGRYYIGE
ncbi:hypothetical protein [Alteromonas facilis]|uniref:hypothetical protein n=1 Tax=Alteromonas facilis TaxID=2048004 RepID=UPI000C28C742|nr:hypothetical protein [Alteromonas facilis]